VSEHVFFYGTLMSPFNRPGRQRITPKLQYAGRGSIKAALFDLGVFAVVVGSTLLLLTAIAHQSLRARRQLAAQDEELEAQEQQQQREGAR